MSTRSWNTSLLGTALALVAVTFPVPSPVHAQSGPENGSLVIVGGALNDPEIVGTFIEMAGGPAAKIVVVPTAGGGDDDAYGDDCRCVRQLEGAGAIR